VELLSPVHLDVIGAGMSKDNTRREFLAAALAVGASAVVSERSLAAELAKKPAAATAGRLTLHAIDTFHGSPGAGMRIDLSILDGKKSRLLKSFETNPGGRTDDAVLSGEAFKDGRYEFLLHFDEYFAKRGAKLPKPNFLNKVPVRFAIADANQRYHVPILFSPWGFSYYRGS
jgi:5-hydroxyisourate hydrolase